ncbi:serine racemase-like isoform X2 [Anneissia japonica]|nr:serine racemase-like isoform X2 [Anneissia japonica]XP_033124861.1 serine racemase-like isoform X2 [Anneissia japonica]XP_033124862.1 serine racemase-like isoform X2 [Anneissia japonica]XP_033124863.1 serine racemase-like isoform X2 [Anneissia japonica]XP_033124864.1 serine racemase-like isoform X2 [Anneissia japonica]XP_033124866.1 serine racemase-like isoform X2 [Anneissia japonica]
MTGCSAVGCKSRPEKNVRLFRFPSDKSRRKLWEVKLSRLNWKPTNNSRLCEVHFENDQFERLRTDRKLRRDAIPTLFSHRPVPKHRKPPKRRINNDEQKFRCPERSLSDHTYWLPLSKQPAISTQKKTMDSKPCTLITKEDLKIAYDVVQQSFLCVRTPTIHHCQQAFGIEATIDLHLKLESSQTTGSFKVRGLANQLANLPQAVSKGECHVITMSAGNYGKALSYAANKLGIPVTVVMPETAPDNRAILMRGYGSKVERVDVSELQSKVDELVAEKGMHFCHPFDDLHLIAGHGSLGLEILEDLPSPDIVLVCCGGGGLLAGTAAAIKLHCKSCRVYGVEPETACAMYQSREKGVAVTDHNCHSIAAGLSPPYAGKICFAHITKFVDEMLLVTDSEIISAVKHLYNAGLKVEPSGAAAFAALMHHRVPDVSGKKVVVVITGGNVSPAELVDIFEL